MFFLFGNKCDESEKRKVGKNEIKNFMKKYPKIKKYFEVSALKGDNIEIALEKICHFLVILYQGDGINKEVNEYKEKIYHHIICRIIITKKMENVVKIILSNISFISQILFDKVY